MTITSFLFGIIIGSIILVCWILYARLAYRKAIPDHLGRIMIKPGPMSWAMGVFALCACLGFGTMVLQTVIYQKEDLIFWMTLGPPLTVLMGYATYVIFWTRIRVSGAAIECRGLKGWNSFEWDDIQSIETHWILGTRLQLNSSKPRPFWPYGYGTSEVIELFEMYEKPFVLA